MESALKPLETKFEILAAKYAAAVTACELILRDDIDDLEIAKAQAKWAMDKINALEGKSDGLRP